MNFEGYKNICRMSQKSYTNGFYFDPRVDIDLLSKHSTGVMCGSACLSSIINVNLMYGHYDKARRICGIFKEIFGENFFLEVMFHGIREEKEIIPLIFKLSSELDIPVICTNDSHYIINSQGKSHEILLCMSQQRCIKDPKRLSFGHMEFYLKDAQEMANIFGSAPHCLYNTVALAERIDTKNIEQNLFGGMRLPKFDIPIEYNNAYTYLSQLAWDGMKKIGWDKSPEHIKALKMELNDIRVAYEANNYDFSTYFLIVRDYIQYAKNNNILVGCGRGSGYSSVLLRCIGVTYGIDPLQYGLLWERFLGFDNLKYIKETDFGFEEDLVQAAAEKDDVGDDKELENDMGGTNGY
jgi:DNA polymerase-3 subunit alpha